jgi:hypothetical protein
MISSGAITITEGNISFENICFRLKQKKGSDQGVSFQLKKAMPESFSIFSSNKRHSATSQRNEAYSKQMPAGWVTTLQLVMQ